jgi:hypothetical protein
VSRPFPLSAKPGRSALPSIHTVLSPPAPVQQEGISPRRNRRKAPPPPPPPPPPPRPQLAKQKEGRARRSSISKSILGLRSHLPPISEGYGVGLMTRRVADPLREAPPPRPHRGKRKEERTRRSSISKSILGLRWHLPPVSEGYGVGLMTREIPDLGQPSSYPITQ